jgi:hypothetical protein
MRNSREQYPSNKDDLVSSVTVEVWRVLHAGGLAADLIFVPYVSSCVLLDCGLNGRPCM